MSHQWLMTFFTQARCRCACIGYIKNSCQDRWHVQHAVIEWHVVTKSIILHTARVSLEKWHVSPLAQVPDLYESFFFCSNITGFVDRVQGISVTWQVVTVKISKYGAALHIAKNQVHIHTVLRRLFCTW